MINILNSIWRKIGLKCLLVGRATEPGLQTFCDTTGKQTLPRNIFSVFRVISFARRAGKVFRKNAGPCEIDRVRVSRPGPTPISSTNQKLESMPGLESGPEFELKRGCITRVLLHLLPGKHPSLG
jgi:hypothetical protein